MVKEVISNLKVPNINKIEFKLRNQNTLKWRTKMTRFNVCIRGTKDEDVIEQRK